MSQSEPSPPESPSPGVLQSLIKWGDNSFQPMVLAALIAPLHLKPFSFIGGVYVPASLTLASFLSLHGFKKDAAGFVAANSGLYLLLAMRRRHRIREKFSPRGLLRGVALAFCALDVAAGSLAYAYGDRRAQAKHRRHHADTPQQSSDDN